jgi:hypothetical protein
MQISFQVSNKCKHSIRVMPQPLFPMDISLFYKIKQFKFATNWKMLNKL